MGLIRAALSAATGNLADQWKEFFYCDSMGKEVLMTRGIKGTYLYVCDDALREYFEQFFDVV